MGSVSDDDDEDEDALKVDEAKIGRSKQMDFAKVEKRVRTTGGGSTGTVRNLRIREDIAKYLLNLDGDDQYRMSGQALEFKQLNIHAWEALEILRITICKLLRHKLNCCIRTTRSLRRS